MNKKISQPVLDHRCACGAPVGVEVTPERKLLTRWGEVAIYRCPECGLAQDAHFPTSKQVREMYATTGIYHALTDEQFQTLEKNFHHVVEDLARVGVRKGKVLEIGCNAGYALTVLRRAGFEVQGVEMNEDTRQEAVEQYEIPTVATLEDLPAGQRYDVVLLSHVLEHIPEVAGFLDALHERLVPGGVLFVKVPNYGSIFARYIAKGRWHSYLPLQHQWYFEKATLKALLQRHGFEPLTVYTREFLSSNGAPLYKKVVRGAFSLLEKTLDSGQELVGIFRKAD
ncbi:MAG: class I SAM-dependent methyltransferase [Bacteroidetes bacterium]|nr:MAG: class I SAM-dependent methyltransferase [Bacteroidota bacterium]